MEFCFQAEPGSFVPALWGVLVLGLLDFACTQYSCFHVFGKTLPVVNQLVAEFKLPGGALVVLVLPCGACLCSVLFDFGPRTWLRCGLSPPTFPVL